MEEENQTKSGSCLQCGKDTTKKCSKCGVSFYCSKKHMKFDRSNHRKDCRKLRRGPEKTFDIDIVADLSEIACKVFADKYLIHSVGVRYPGISIGRIKETKESRTFMVTNEVNLSTKQSLELCLSKGYSRNDFWQAYCVGKASTYTIAFTMAMRNLLLEYGANFTYKGKKVDYFAIVNVTVEKFKKVFLLYEWDKMDEIDEKSDHLKNHQMIWFKVDNKNVYMDFCSPMFGVYKYSAAGFPCCIMEEEEMNKYAKVDEMISHTEVDKNLQELLSESMNTGDIRASMAASCGLTIVDMATRF